MASQSLYRKWRSQTFSDLIGQEATTRTLLNAVREGRLAHAYLFCGPRGTGKTSAARLLAKAINCANPRDGEPCNECLSCREITTGRSPDVIEIDAASNTGVDNIRDLRENVNLLGTGGRFKVYIVDECHMLSPQAFNALLKTLEEPPPHVIFVLATTEAHKVLPTIVSRCQRFDFRRISMRDIVARLRQVAAGEGLELEPAAADLLARAAQGGMRDALSLLDQAIAYCGTHIDLERARTMLGLADPGALRGLIVAVAEQRAADALHQLNELVVTGADLRQVQQQLGEEWRALLLARAGADVGVVMDRTPDEARELSSLANRFSLEELMACARVFARSETPARGLPVPQLALELALLECLSIRRSGGFTVALQPVPANGMANGQPAQAVSPTPGTPAHATRAASPRPAREEPVQEQVLAARSDSRSTTQRGQESEVAARGVVETPSESLSALPTPVALPGPTAMASNDAEVAQQPEIAGNESPGAPSAPDRGTDWLAEAQREWSMIQKVCKQRSPRIAALLHHAKPVAMRSGSPPTIAVEVLHKFHFDNLKVPENKQMVEWSMEQVLGTAVRLSLVLEGDGGGGAKSGTARRAASNAASPTQSTPRTDTRPDGRTSGASAEALNGNGHAAQRNGHAPASQAPSSASASPPAASSASRNGNGRQPQGMSLDQEAQADAIVQEVQRELGAQLLEVRPLDDEHESE